MTSIMGLIISIVIISVLVILYLYREHTKRRNRQLVFKGNPPLHLGVDREHPVYPLVVRYEEAWPAGFANHLRTRTFAEHPEMSVAEYKWRKLELDRFFIISGILRESHMFSIKVDDLWHEMLMFTEEYDSWCQNYIGVKLHHRPNVAAQLEPMPHARAWFDWVYSQLFAHTPYTEAIWGEFFQYRMDSNILQLLESSTTERSMTSTAGQLFHPVTSVTIEEVSTAVNYLVSQARTSIESAKLSNWESDLEGRGNNVHRKSCSCSDCSNSRDLTWAATIMLIISWNMTDDNDYEKAMQPFLDDISNDQHKAATSTSSCGTAYSCSSRPSKSPVSSCSSDGDASPGCGSGCSSG
ncbi:hypothetical protein [Paenibacillus sp. 481]|uniref:hypothetical protein n=1 Tax=Paenibacillus sp. 481 TaxID=2835869 RepID=UPI001E61DB54|nr:hypothetical protein [Paenibacillus sp. 481]UHA75653.1 hypothetical protein KIK04_12065 [Paenibacillus sp. 481]